MTSRRGLSTVGVIVAIVAVVIVIGVAVYFISAPARTKMKDAYAQFAEWTPENIAKDPKGYLSFCEEKTNEAIQKCKASKIAISAQQAKLEQMRQDTEDKLKVGEKALEELKDLYRKAETDKKWPLTWQGKGLEQEQAKRQVLRLAGEIESKTKLSKEYKAAGDQLRVQLTKVDDAFDRANEQLSKIKVNREKLAVQQITDDLKNNLVAMKSAIQTTIVDVDSQGGTLSLDDLAARSEAAVDDSKFDEIMKKK